LPQSTNYGELKIALPKQMTETDVKQLAEVLEHIIQLNLPFEHCITCFSAKIMALSFILNAQKRLFVSNEFKDRVNHIVDGLILFLQQRYTSAVYVILPQLDGIVMSHLKNVGVLEESQGFPVWTNKAVKHRPKTDCRNIREAILEGIANKDSRIGKTFNGYTSEFLDSLRQLRNKTLHGETVQIPENEAVDVILFLNAIHHDLELFNVTYR